MSNSFFSLAADGDGDTGRTELVRLVGPKLWLSVSWLAALHGDKVRLLVYRRLWVYRESIFKCGWVGRRWDVKVWQCDQVG